MTSELRTALIGIYTTFRSFQMQLQTQELLTTALLGVMRERPEFERLYAKHYAAVTHGELGQRHALALHGIDLMLQMLHGEDDTDGAN